MPTLLSQLKPGQSATVKSVLSGPHTQRLLEMGLTPGAQLKVISIAPIGKTLAIQLKSFGLSIRPSEAEKIEVQL